MNVALRKPRMDREAFLDWAQAQDVRHEFDGLAPVAMTGETRNHNRIALALHRSLHDRLKGSGCEALGADAGVATIGEAVRYPDALVTCTKGPGADRLVPGVVAVFEVLSPTSGRIDRIDKLREYRAVPSILRYVILEHRSIGLVVFVRSSGNDDWTATALTAGDLLRMPEIGVEIPVIELYAETDLSDAQPSDSEPVDGTS